MTAKIEISNIPIEVKWRNNGGTDTGYQNVNHNPEDELDRPDNELLFCKPSLSELKELGIIEEEVMEKINEIG